MKCLNFAEFDSSVTTKKTESGKCSYSWCGCNVPTFLYGSANLNDLQSLSTKPSSLAGAGSKLLSPAEHPHSFKRHRVLKLLFE